MEITYVSNGIKHCEVYYYCIITPAPAHAPDPAPAPTPPAPTSTPTLSPILTPILTLTLTPSHIFATKKILLKQQTF